MKKVRFLPEAEAELLAEVAYYSRARSGLGKRFQLAIEAASARAVAQPFSGAPAVANTRTLAVNGFPFRLVYRVELNQLLVVAIAHHKRQPQYWVTRIEEAE